MKIALLNLPLDNNYGGNLQRYALIKTLENLGHDVTFLLCCSKVPNEAKYKLFCRYLKRIIRKLCFNHKEEIFVEKKRQKLKILNDLTALRFVISNFKCSPCLYSKKELCEFVNTQDFEALIVGSDQVWRQRIAHEYGLGTYFLDFLEYKTNIRRIAFAASLGTDEIELSEKDALIMKSYYSKFYATSIREKSSLKLLMSYGWDKPKATVLLDPTFLLSKDDYIKLRHTAETYPSNGNMFCYILDGTAEKTDIIREEATRRGLKAFYASIADSTNFSIFQWLRSFEDAEFIVTDSFHGVVFSIIYNKPFRLIKNPFRGNARFDSLFDILGIGSGSDKINWTAVNAKIVRNREQSLLFLNNSLK